MNKMPLQYQLHYRVLSSEASFLCTTWKGLHSFSVMKFMITEEKNYLQERVFPC